MVSDTIFLRRPRKMVSDTIFAQGQDPSNGDTTARAAALTLPGASATLSRVTMAGLLCVFLIATGVAAITVGAALARQQVWHAGRVHDLTAARASATLEGWDGWFLGGFSRVATGLRWLTALAAGCFWTLVGAGFIALGIRYVVRL